MSRIGRYLLALCTILHCSQAEIARRAAISKSLLTTWGYTPAQGGRYPQWATIARVYEAIAKIAHEKDITLPPCWEYGFRIAALYEETIPDVTLEMLEDRAREVRGEPSSAGMLTDEQITACESVFQDYLDYLAMKKRQRSRCDLGKP